MITFDLRKRKIRGWKRRAKKIERWKNAYMELDKKALAAYDRDYVKVWIAPFFSLQKHTLPFWYKRLVIEALLEIYASWKQTMDTFDEPYYLKVWVFEKDFMSSQVVVSARSYLHFYDQTFEGLKPVGALPDGMMVEAAKGLDWEQGVDVAAWFERELQEDLQSELYSQEEIQAIRESAYRVTEYNEDLIYLIKNDTVWVGGQ
ncbi:hypothetical protein [Enterococcus larvae]|uniref:hypothetical protein n=1 Tax=Enterococcus larvae TaxID=2794352 RepID=UPI003F31BCB0